MFTDISVLCFEDLQRIVTQILDACLLRCCYSVFAFELHVFKERWFHEHALSHQRNDRWKLLQKRLLIMFFIRIAFFHFAIVLGDKLGNCEHIVDILCRALH